MTLLLLALGCGDGGADGPTEGGQNSGKLEGLATVDNNCDGVDDDLDGLVDEDASFSFYMDYDGDSWGNEGLVVTGCPARGLVTLAGDCDDGDRRTYPGAQEHCDNLDHDCDGEVMDDDAVDGWTWYEDADGDGYGNAEVVLYACVAGAGWTTDRLDCDDTNASVSPDGVEVCDGLGVDEDCDELADDEDPDGAVGQTFAWRDIDRDGYAAEGAASDWFCTFPDGGWATLGGDCDDVDAARAPGLPEHCDDIDEDCDGAVDEDPVDGLALYVDEDEDGYGVAPTGSLACAATVGTALYTNDCDDDNNLRHPGAAEPCSEGMDLNCDGFSGGEDHDGDGVAACEDCDDADPARWGAAEVCNGIDDNCDGWVDGELASDSVEVWPDVDGDGYGDEELASWVCSIDPGMVTVGGDCDDLDASIHPGVEDADCSGSVDLDCDGTVPGADFDGDGERSCTDCDDLDATVFTGAPDPCLDGIDQDCDGTDKYCFPGADLLTSETGNLVRQLAVGDLDGDGLAEVVGADADYAGRTSDRGDVYGFTGGLSGAELPSTADWLWTGGSTGDQLGSALAIGLGGDGLARLAIGAQGESDHGDGSGAVYLLAEPATTDPLDAALIVRGEEDFAFAGRGLALGGDLDADGVPDLVVGAPGQDTRTGDEGCVAVWSTASTGDELASDGEAWICGTTAWRGFGQVLHLGTDLDGDGLDELLVGAPMVDAGSVWRYAAPVLGTLTDADADERWDGAADGARLGTTLATAEDLDGDGLGELFLAAPEDPGAGLDSGCVYRLGAGVAIADAPWSICGAAYDLLGSSLAAADEALAIGSPGDDTDTTDAGRVLIFRGVRTGSSSPADADTIVLGTGGYPHNGELAVAADLDADGRTELISGNHGIVWPTWGWAWSSP